MAFMYQRRGAEKLNAIAAPPWAIEKAIRTFKFLSVGPAKVKVEIFRELENARQFLDLSKQAGRDATRWLNQAAEQYH